MLFRSSQSNFFVNIPNEGDAILTTDSRIELDGIQNLVFSGTVSHTNLESCEIKFNNNPYQISENGVFSIDAGIVEENTELTVNVECGQWTKSFDSKTIQVVILNLDDLDGDGIQNDADKCPNGMGKDEGWTSTSSTDYDSDGCNDESEDLDDDGDMLPDFDDDCLSELGWISNQTSDHDADGCSDNLQDEDDDNDGVLDLYDDCPRGDLNWESKSYTEIGRAHV